MRGVGGNDCLQLLPHGLRGFFRNDLPLHRSGILQHGIAAAVYYMVYHIRFNHIAAVDRRRVRGNQFQRRGFVGLSVCTGSQIDLCHSILRHDHAGNLARQIDAGLFRQTEALQIIAELLHAQPQTNFHKGRVAGVGQCLCERLRAVTGTQRAADFRVLYLQIAGAEERVAVQIDQVFLKRRCRSHNFNGRTRRVDLTDRLVPPLFFSGFQICVLILRFRQFFQLCCHNGIVDLRGIVQVEGRAGRHGVDRTGFRVHDDAGGTVVDLELLHHFRHALFQIVLQGGVQCQIQGRTVLRIIGGGIPVGHFLTVGTLCRNDSAVHAGEVVVVLIFQTILSVAVAVGEADDCSCQFILGIVPPCGRLLADKGQLQFIEICGDLVRHIFFHLGFQHVVATAFGIGFLQLSPIDAQRFHQKCGDGLLQLIHVHQICRFFVILRRSFFLFGVCLFDCVHFVLILFGVDVHVVHRCTPRQCRAVGIINGTAVRPQGHGTEMVVVRQRFVLLVIHHRNFQQLSGNCRTADHQNGHADRRPATHHRRCRTRLCFCFLFLFFFPLFMDHLHVQHTSVF